MTSILDKGQFGEDFINQIAYKSFFKYWCYPNPKDELGDKKEICDLLIVFKDVIIIICVKNYEFKGVYERYFRKTIEKDIKQIAGAERKLTDRRTTVYIKHPGRSVEIFNKNAVNKIFRVVVHLGEHVRFYPLFERTNKDKFVNILDKETFEMLLSELDTLPDFIEYLEKKEIAFKDRFAIILPKEENDFDSNTADQFQKYSFTKPDYIQQKYVLISGTEFDLLALYLKDNRQIPDQITSERFGWLFLQIDGTWVDFQKRKEVLLKKSQDHFSYFIDNFVQNEILKQPNERSISLAKELLSFSRFDRRVISKSFISFYNENKNKGESAISRRFWTLNDIGFVFVLYSSKWQNQNIDILIDLAVTSFCIYDKYKVQKVILIANRYDLQQFKFGMIEKVLPFDKQTEKLIMEDVKKLGWFTNIEYSFGNEKEYPDE